MKAGGGGRGAKAGQPVGVELADEVPLSAERSSSSDTRGGEGESAATGGGRVSR